MVCSGMHATLAHINQLRSRTTIYMVGFSCFFPIYIFLVEFWNNIILDLTGGGGGGLQVASRIMDPMVTGFGPLFW